MKNIVKLLCLVIVLILTIENVIAERKPLTFRDWGLYCGTLRHIPKTQRPTGWKYYDPYFIENNTPWDFLIIQVDHYRTEEERKELKKIVEGLHARSIKVILRLHIFRNRNKKAKKLKFYKQEVDYILNSIDINKVYAVTVDEENIYWNGFGALLKPVYDYIKSKHPDLPTYQWYTPMVTPKKHAKSGWRDLRGDGWISDVYCMVGKRFEKHIVKHLDLKKKFPLIHIIWASPTWTYGSKGAEPKTWWHSGFGREQFDDQLKTCREYNIPVAFFAVQPSSARGGILWAWAATEPIVTHVYHWLCAKAREADNLPASSIGYRSATPNMVKWAEANKAKYSLMFDIDGSNDLQVTLEDLLEFNKQKTLTTDTKYVKIIHSLGKEADLLEKRTRGLFLCGGKGLRQVELISEVTFAKPVLNFDLTVSGSAIKALGGNLKIEFSKDGKEWKSNSTPNIQTSKASTVEITARDIYGKQDKKQKFWVKYTLINSAGLPTNVSTSLFSIKLSAFFTKGSLGD